MAMRHVSYTVYFLILVLAMACSNAVQTDAELPYFTKIRQERTEKNRYIISNGILDEAYISGFNGLQYFEPDTLYKVQAKVNFIPKAERSIKTNTSEVRTYFVFCRLDFKIHGTDLKLYAYVEDTNQVKQLFVPFKDKTCGKSTYLAGRFMDLTYNGETDLITLDFNLAYNPYCHYSHSYSCPLVPFENTLPISIEAGEKKLHD